MLIQLDYLYVVCSVVIFLAMNYWITDEITVRIKLHVQKIKDTSTMQPFLSFTEGVGIFLNT